MHYFFFSYHKSGTDLCGGIARRLAERFGWSRGAHLGLVTQIDPTMRVIAFAHSLIGFDLSCHPHRGVRIIRDPRDIWLSGYLYHRRCTEPWCVHENFDLWPPIRFPNVPYSQQHRAEDWKRAYIRGLGGMSYQRNLLTLDQDEGLRFELRRYAAWTIEAMVAWQPDPHTIDIKIEDLVADFDGVLSRILRHFGLSEPDIATALAVCAPEDIGRMSDAQLAQNPHIYARKISKWRDMLTPAQCKSFEALHDRAIKRLGY